MLAITVKSLSNLETLTRSSMEKIRDVTDRMIFGDFSLGDWYAKIEQILKVYHTAAYLDGLGLTSFSDLSLEQKSHLSERVGQQLGFLEGFADDIQAGRYEGKPQLLKARALLYSQNLKASWWSGRTAGWPLPAMPGDGTTQCIVRCKCSWEGKNLDTRTMTGDWYWIMNSSAEHCQTCEVRASTWNPLRIVKGELKGSGS